MHYQPTQVERVPAADVEDPIASDVNVGSATTLQQHSPMVALKSTCRPWSVARPRWLHRYQDSAMFGGLFHPEAAIFEGPLKFWSRCRLFVLPCSAASLYALHCRSKILA